MKDILQLLKGKIRSGYVLAFFLLLFSYFLIFSSTRQLSRQTGSVTYHYTLINKLQLLYTAITEAEAGVRGYAITKQLHYLDPYYSARRKLATMYQELKRLAANDTMQTKRLEKLSGLIERRLILLAQTIATVQNEGKGRTERKEIINAGNILVMDSIRSFQQEVTAAEDAAMLKRNAKLAGFFSGARIITMLSLLTAVLAISYSLITYNKENKAKLNSERKASRYGEELEANIRELIGINAELKELRNNEKFAATGRIARTIAHEVRNPLTNISLATEQLQEMAIQHHESFVLLDMISRNADRINQLVADLLNATKFLQLDIRDSNINDILDETLELAKDRIGLNHIRVEKYYAPEMCGVRVDKKKIQLAFLNIIVNAIEAMEKNKGVLQLYTRKEGSKCVVEIKDNGSGMDDDTLQKLFEPYFTGKPRGNGLGLTNSQNIILNHKGSIKVQSKSDEGSSFIITLDLSGEG